MKRCFLFFVLILASHQAFSSIWDRPILKLKPYSALNFPPMMTKGDFEFIVERAANRIPYKRAYYKFGHISDLMHGHVMFNHEDDLFEWDDFRKEDVSWEGLSPVAVLFHSQEYSSSWKHFFEGDDLRTLLKLKRKNRNYLLWLKDTGLFHRKGWIQRANGLMQPGVKPNKAHTLYDSKLDQRHFGKYPRVSGSWSFYFFRVDCQLIPEHLRVHSNFVTFYHRGEKQNICILLDNLKCGGSAYNAKSCPGVLVEELLPEYQTVEDLIQQ